MNNNDNYNKYIILLTLSGYFKFEMKCDAKRKIKYLKHMSNWNYKSKIKKQKRKKKQMYLEQKTFKLELMKTTNARQFL